MQDTNRQAKSVLKAVVFDVGNVLIEWDPRHLYRKLLPDEAAIDAFFTETDIFSWNVEQDRGRPFAEGVRLHCQKFPHRSELICAFDERWPEMVPGEIAGTIQILEELDKAGVALHAITNFSNEKFKLARARFPFFRRFDIVVVSGDERLLKPEPAIYRTLLERTGLEAEACVFVDDSPKNVEGARATGMQAIHFTTPDALRAELKRLGLPLR